MKAYEKTIRIKTKPGVTKKQANELFNAIINTKLNKKLDDRMSEIVFVGDKRV